MSDAEQRAAQLSASPYHSNGHSNGGGHRRGKRRGKGRRTHTVAKVLLSSVLVLGMVTGLGVTFLYRHLNGNLNYDNVDAQLGTDRPDEVEVEGPKDPINILVMGSDSRDGAGNNIDGLTGGGERSDTTIMIHLSADRQNAYGVSIPRDSLVDRPECYDEDGDTIPGATSAMWNEAFSVGGPACTIRQFEQLTDIRINNYVVVDFQGFQAMVDAIDGVEVCVPQDIDDREHGIVIKAGTREISGKEALAYVRVRHVEGTDGSDLGRIKRQQAFVAAMANKVLSGIGAGPPGPAGQLPQRRDGVADHRHRRTSAGWRGSASSSRTSASSGSSSSPSRGSTRRPTPTGSSGCPEADELWEKVRNDAPLGRFGKGSITADDDPTGSGGATESPSATRRAESPSESDHREPVGRRVLAVGVRHRGVGRRDAGRGARSGWALRVTGREPARTGVEAPAPPRAGLRRRAP